MKKSIIISFFIFLSNTSFCLSAQENSINMSDLSGKYLCNGYDQQDKSLRGTTINLVLDKKNSLLQNNYVAYRLQWSAPSTFRVKGLPPNVGATGAVAASGNSLAVYFKNTSPKAPTDYGVLIGSATHDQNEQGISHTILHLFGYQPVYKGGDNSTWTCVKN